MKLPELRDIHLPESALWWPPAPGWWFLFIAALLLFLMSPRIYRWFRHRSMKRHAIRLFDQIRKNYERNDDQKQLLFEVSSLLRRVLIAYRGRQQTAGLTGERWLQQLKDLAEKPCFNEAQQELLSRGQYAPQVEFDGEALIRSCEQWLRSLPRRRPDVPV